MKLNRRKCLKNAICLPMLSDLAMHQLMAQTQNQTQAEDNLQASLQDNILISSVSNSQGQHFLMRYHTLSGEQNMIAIETRGHGSKVTPDGKMALTIARRPGTFAFIQPLFEKDKPQAFYAKPNRHFYGHAVFIDNGRYLLTTENDYINNRGLIGVRDVHNDYKWIDEIESFGIGGHELVVLNDDKTVVVANGGIQTHPRQQRKKLNLNTMESSLAYIDIHQGKLIEEYFLEDSLMSIRHLDVNKDNQIIIACQHQSAQEIMSPMIYFHQGETNLVAADLEDEFFWLNYQNYTASVCQHENGVACVSSSRGNKIAFWDVTTKALMAEDYFNDVSGVAISRDKKYFIATSGKGDIRFYNTTDASENISLRQRLSNIRWDNHLTVI